MATLCSGLLAGVAAVLTGDTLAVSGEGGAPLLSGEKIPLPLLLMRSSSGDTIAL
jgi:hypothetical protein